jgi:hypothetical protein
MKRFLLFAGDGNSNQQGVNGLVGDYDAVAEAFLSLVDNQIRSTWWHILDTQTGEVIEREHLRAKDSTLSFAKSDRIVGTVMPRVAVLPPAKPLSELERSIRNVVETSVKANGQIGGAHA